MFSEYLEKRFISTLQNWHTGAEKAITYRELAKELGISNREVRLLKNHLVTEHKKPIGSTSGSSSGYFWIKNQKEFEHCRAEIISRIKELKKLADSLEEAWYQHIGGKPKLFEEAG